MRLIVLGLSANSYTFLQNAGVVNNTTSGGGLAVQLGWNPNIGIIAICQDKSWQWLDGTSSIKSSPGVALGSMC